MFERLRQHFLDASVECIQFDDDVALARGLYRDDYRVILVDAATGIDGTRTVFARRAFYGGRRAPLLVVGTFTDRDSLERAFDAGADDVVLAPFDRNELAARAFRAMRRVEAEPAPRDEQRVTLGAYTLDQQASTVQIAGRTVRVTTREFAIAWLLFSRAGEYVTRRQLAGAIWGSTEDIVGRRLEQHIYKLRRKLELTGESGVALRTMYAHGYRIEQTDGSALEASAQEEMQDDKLSALLEAAPGAALRAMAELVPACAPQSRPNAAPLASRPRKRCRARRRRHRACPAQPHGLAGAALGLVCQPLAHRRDDDREVGARRRRHLGPDPHADAAGFARRRLTADPPRLMAGAMPAISFSGASRKAPELSRRARRDACAYSPWLRNCWAY
ncbi:winged helix-turn-helix transcriptional regulator [Burkholderia gladioli]|uniref:winged helix-turn-helix transcriptional regulator n=1 Tax=Burkholderia gladioli TaxID=28095 RepID=UPI001FC89BDF|nr:response regulator transcription factor [Burkholderia gladioli]